MYMHLKNELTANLEKMFFWEIINVNFQFILAFEKN